METIPLFKVFMSPNAKVEVGKVLDSGYIGQGPKVDEFEEILKSYFDNDYVVTVNSGTSALHLALHLLKKPGKHNISFNGSAGYEKSWPGLNDGDEVLATALTCLYGSSEVLLPDGSTKSISELVNSKYDGYVVSFNEKTKKLENKKITNWYKSPIGEREFIRLNYEHSIGKRSKVDGKHGTWVTNDHKVLTKNRGWVKSEDLQDKELVVTSNVSLNKEQEKALFGMMLGDGGIRINKTNKRITTARYNQSHVFYQEKFGDFKMGILKSFKPLKTFKTKYKQSNDGYRWTTKNSPYLYDIYNKFYENGKKILPKDFSKDNLSEIGLAIWFMDDGNINKKNENSVFCSESFSIDDNVKLSNILLNKFNIKTTISGINSKKLKPRLQLNKTETKKLFNIIGSYILPSMYYKLPNSIVETIKFNNKLWNLGENEVYFDEINIIKNEKPTNRKSHLKSVYCIDVEDNHNFISGGLVVHNCTASNWPILANNLNIKWVDIDPTTLNMDLDDLERKITPKTKAIMLVHWGGYPNDLDRVKQIQKKSYEMYGFKPAVIEDCAHSFGSKYKGKLLGNHGNISMYTLQAIKHITSIDGGLLFLPHMELYNRSKLIRWYGIDRNSNKKDFRCLHPSTLVNFADGTNEKICNIVKNKIDKDVLVFENGQFIPRKINEWVESPLGDRHYFKVSTKFLQNKNKTTVTNDHKLLTETRGWVRTDDINENEKILTSFIQPNDKQKEMIIGSLLGDSSLSVKKTNSKYNRGVISETHSFKQREYINLKIKSLGSLISTTYSYEPSIDKRGVKMNGKLMYFTKSLPYFGELRNEFYVSGKKIIPKNLIEKHFSNLMLSTWFMDDGRTQVTNSFDGLKYHCSLHTNSFTYDDVNWLSLFLNEKGFINNIIDTNKRNKKNNGFIISFTTIGSEKLINVISKYVPQSMRYKVGHLEHIKYNEKLWDLGLPDCYYDESVIVPLEHNPYKTTYCLEVDSPHSNFSTSAVVVHNCEADINEWGYKFHMNDVNATVGIENLKHAEDIIGKHKSNAKFYDENLQNIPGLTTLTRHEGHESAFWIYSMLVDNRDGFFNLMKEHGIVASQVHERNDKHSCVEEYKTSLPTLDKTIGKVVSIPVGWWVTEKQRQYIVDTIKKGW